MESCKKIYSTIHNHPKPIKNNDDYYSLLVMSIDIEYL